MEILRKCWELWSANIETNQATHHTVDMKEGMRFICQQSYCARQNCREVLCKYINRQLEAGVLEQAHSDRASSIALVPKQNCTFRLCMGRWCLNAVPTSDTYQLQHIYD